MVLLYTRVGLRKQFHYTSVMVWSILVPVSITESCAYFLNYVAQAGFEPLILLLPPTEY